jgi:hypothetical protein
MALLYHMPQKSTGQPPEPKLTSVLIVLMAFDRDDEGNLQPVFEPREMPDERRAMATARLLSHQHAGVITWKRDANPAIGEFRPPEILFQDGDVPDLD